MQNQDLDPYAKELQEAFIASCIDDLKKTEKHLDTLSKGASKPQDTVKSLQRIAHNLKGMGSTCGFPSISVICHRLEDYLFNVTSPGEREISDLHTFFDRIDDILHAGETVSTAEIIRELPVYQSAEPAAQSEKAVSLQGEIWPSVDNKPQLLEVVLIMPGGKVQRKMIEQELAACGCRVTNVSSSTQAFDMVLRIRPDIILSNYMIDDLANGVELARIFHLLEATKETPFILLTSFARQSKELRHLPDDVKIARKGEHFLDDFSKSLIDSHFMRSKK